MKYPKFNYHTHTARCMHACGEDEEYVKCAVQAGFDILGMSDHAPYKGMHMPGKRMDYDEMEGYIDSFRELKKKYRKKIDIRIGFEAEYFDDYLEELHQLKECSDYLILGQHTPCKKDVVSYNHRCTKEDALSYADLLCKGMRTGLFTYVAHPDYYFSGTDDISDEFIQAAHMICKQAVQCNLPLEINVKGVCAGKKRYPQGAYYPYPNRVFWKIAAQYPVRCIFGFDAHEPAFLMDRKAFECAVEMTDGLSLDIIDKPLF